uniref:RNase H type-1 domain-containing protein n=1 Tax=Cannabis sativa TaxID=3483 RepID=A0A803PKE1_CANSA
MQNILASLWQPGMGMFVKQLDNNQFLFQFFHEIDIQRVINGIPWTYDRMQLIIERLKVGGDPKLLALNTLDIGVQLHDVEPGFMAESTIRKPVVSDVVTLAKLNFIDWYNAQKNNQPSHEINGSVDTYLEHWTPPQFPTIKINVDGAISTNERRFGIGLVARSADGIVLQAKKMSKMGILKPHVVEAIGIKEALSWIKANAWTNVVVESDCLRVIRDIQKSKHMASPYSHIISECLTLCLDIVGVSFNFVKRSANKVAHVLARSSLSEADCTLSRDALPIVVASLILDDLI